MGYCANSGDANRRGLGVEVVCRRCGNWSNGGVVVVAVELAEVVVYSKKL